MTKRRVHKEEGEFINKKFSSGVTVKVTPFPIGIHERILREGFKKFPNIPPPLKEIDSFGDEDGKKETIEDVDNEDWKKEQKEQEEKRDHYIAEKLLDIILKLCIEVDETEQEKTISMLEKTLDSKFPEDEIERRVEYLIAYVIRTKNDYASLLMDTLSLSVTGDAEVAERLNSFQRDVGKGIDDKETIDGSSSDTSSV